MPEPISPVTTTNGSRLATANPMDAERVGMLLAGVEKTRIGRLLEGLFGEVELVEVHRDGRDPWVSPPAYYRAARTRRPAVSKNPAEAGFLSSYARLTLRRFASASKPRPARPRPSSASVPGSGTAGHETEAVATCPSFCKDEQDSVVPAARVPKRLFCGDGETRLRCPCSTDPARSQQVTVCRPKKPWLGRGSRHQASRK